MQKVTYTYECGHKLRVDAEEVLTLQVEPNWGCLECNDARVTDTKIEEVIVTSDGREHICDEDCGNLKGAITEREDNTMCRCAGRCIEEHCPCSTVPDPNDPYSKRGCVGGDTDGWCYCECEGGSQFTHKLTDMHEQATSSCNCTVPFTSCDESTCPCAEMPCGDSEGLCEHPRGCIPECICKGECSDIAIMDTIVADELDKIEEDAMEEGVSNE